MKEERMNQPGIVGYIVKTEMICGAWQRIFDHRRSILLNNELLSKN